MLLAVFSSAQASGNTEELLAARVFDEGIQIIVRTGGCTEKSDFKVIARKADGITHIEFQRLRPDFCKGFFPKGMSISYAWNEIPGLDNTRNVKIINRVRNK